MPIKTAEQVLRDAKEQIKEYTPAEVMEMQKRGEKLTLLDVRDLNEASLGKIPGAIHISRGRLEQNIEAAVPRDANVVI
jgi:rhodanese-related sulfurtransferase